jgi:hypothetical protein
MNMAVVASGLTQPADVRAGQGAAVEGVMLRGRAARAKESLPATGQHGRDGDQVGDRLDCIAITPQQAGCSPGRPSPCMIAQLHPAVVDR